jgi:hypothetical protein
MCTRGHLPHPLNVGIVCLNLLQWVWKSDPTLTSVISSEALPNFWTYPAWFTPGSLTLQANPNEKDTASPVPYSLVLF